MILRPRKFRRKNRQKARRRLVGLRSKLSFGEVGVQLLQPMWVNGRQISRLKILIRRGTKRAATTRRRVKVNLFPNLPVTRKVAGSRMGKGKGKLAGWVSQTRSGVTVVEYRSLRVGGATYFGDQLRYRLPVRSALVWRDRDRDYTNLYTSSRMKARERSMRAFIDCGDEI